MALTKAHARMIEGSSVNVKDFGAVGDGVTDDTAAIQAAIDYVSTNDLGALFAPPGVYKGNWAIKSDCVIVGAGRASTTFSPYIDGPVFATSTSNATVRFGFKDLRINGNSSFASNTGIKIGTTTASTWCDSIILDNCIVENCGSHGVYAFGSSASGPFVQGLRVIDCMLDGNEGIGLFLNGTVIETAILGSIITSNGDTGGTIPNCKLGKDVGGDVPSRVSFYTCTFNHNNALSSGNAGQAIFIEGGKQVTFDTCDLENADPMIKVAGAVTTRNITVRGCALTSVYAADSFIDLDDVNGMVIDNCNFGTASTVNYFIKSDQGPSRVKQIDIRNNVLGTATVKPVYINALASISGAALNMFQDYLFMAPGAPVSLNNIYDPNGGTGTSFTAGQIITLEMVNANTVTVGVGGNIRLSGGSSFAMTTNNTLTLIWSDYSQVWKEIGRSS
jgi:hypothetical protein